MRTPMLILASLTCLACRTVHVIPNPPSEADRETITRGVLGEKIGLQYLSETGPVVEPAQDLVVGPDELRWQSAERVTYSDGAWRKVPSVPRAAPLAALCSVSDVDHRRGAGLGALAGTAGGLLLGTLIGAIAIPPPYFPPEGQSCWGPCSGQVLAATIVAGALLGGVLGAVIGGIRGTGTVYEIDSSACATRDP